MAADGGGDAHATVAAGTGDYRAMAAVPAGGASPTDSAASNAPAPSGGDHGQAPTDPRSLGYEDPADAGLRVPVRSDAAPAPSDSGNGGDTCAGAGLATDGGAVQPTAAADAFNAFGLAIQHLVPVHAAVQRALHAAAVGLGPAVVRWLRHAVGAPWRLQPHWTGDAMDSAWLTLEPSVRAMAWPCADALAYVQRVAAWCVLGPGAPHVDAANVARRGILQPGVAARGRRVQRRPSG